MCKRREFGVGEGRAQLYLGSRVGVRFACGECPCYMYAKSGSIDDSRLVFDGLEDRNVVTWNVMIGGLAEHGCGCEALEVFGKMNAAGVKADGLRSWQSCRPVVMQGLERTAVDSFEAMRRDYGIEPTVVHCSCMVDLLGRAGHLEEAKLFGNVPVEPDVETWGALLGACRTHGSVELGEYAAKELLMLEPNHAGTYALLSSIYAAAGKWISEKISSDIVCVWCSGTFFGASEPYILSGMLGGLVAS